VERGKGEIEILLSHSFFWVYSVHCFISYGHVHGGRRKGGGGGGGWGEGRSEDLGKEGGRGGQGGGGGERGVGRREGQDEGVKRRELFSFWDLFFRFPFDLCYKFFFVKMFMVICCVYIFSLIIFFCIVHHFLICVVSAIVYNYFHKF